MGPIPAKYFWPGFCVLLLGLSVSSAVATVIAAQSDGGAEVVASYNIDSEQRRERRDQRRENRKLGWGVDVEVPSDAAVGATTTVAFRVDDRDGEPVEGLGGRVLLHSPSLADPVAKSALTPVEGHPGRYRAHFEFQRRGVWDFVVRLDAGDRDFVTRVREEL